MSDIKDTLKDAGRTVAQKAEQAADWVKDKTGLGGKEECGMAKGTSEIRAHMDVIASCGTKVGVVDHIEGGAVKLTKKDSPDGEHHFIPMEWVDRVDNHVHLKKNSQETEQGWKSDPIGLLGAGT
jgi:hypothetical protein